MGWLLKLVSIEQLIAAITALLKKTIKNPNSVKGLKLRDALIELRNQIDQTLNETWPDEE